jgi:predicted metalloprotease with PDZ domain
MALRGTDASMTAYVESRIATAGEECSASLQGKNLHEASNESGEKAPYSCGMVLNLAIDAAVRNAGNADGLFAVWRNYIKRSKDGGAPSETAYLAARGEVANAGLADEVRRIVEVRDADLGSVGRKVQ